MCVDNDSRPPITPIAGGATDARDLTLPSADGTRFMAYAARATRPTGAGMVVIPDVRGLHPYYKELAARFAEVGRGRGRHRLLRAHRADRATGATRSTSCARAADQAGDAPGRHRGRGGAPCAEPRAARCGRSSRSASASAARSSYLQAASGLGYAGVIGFYGWPLGLKRWPDRPKPIDAVSRFRSPVLSIFGGADEGIPPSAVDGVRPGPARKAGVQHDVHRVPRRPAQLLRPEADRVRRRLRRRVEEGPGIRQGAHGGLRRASARGPSAECRESGPARAGGRPRRRELRAARPRRRPGSASRARRRRR